MSQSKGFQRERELVNQFDDAGFGVTRVPKSGGGTKRALPDVLAGSRKQGVAYAIEAKASTSSPIYLNREEVYELVYFSRNFGAKPRVGIRFDRESWYFFHPDDLYKTDGGNYRVTRAKALADGTKFEELTNQTERKSLNEIRICKKKVDSVKEIQKILRAIERGDISIDEGADLLGCVESESC